MVPRSYTLPAGAETAAEEGRKQTAPMTSTMKASARLHSAVKARGESFFTLLLYARGKSAYALPRSAQLCNGDAALPLAVLAEAEFLDALILSERVLHGGAELSRAHAVDDAHFVEVV